MLTSNFFFFFFFPPEKGAHQDSETIISTLHACDSEGTRVCQGYEISHQDVESNGDRDQLGGSDIWRESRKNAVCSIKSVTMRIQAPSSSEET